MSIISRPSSSLSQYRPGTGYEGVLPCTVNNITNCSKPPSRLLARPDQQFRPQSRLSTQSRELMQSKPVSRLSSIHSRPCSRHSMRTDRHQPIKSSKSRSVSRSCVQISDEHVRPVSKLAELSSDYHKLRSASRMSNQSIRSIGEVSPSLISSCSKKSLSVTLDPSDQPDSGGHSSSKLKPSNGNEKCVNGKTIFMAETYNGRSSYVCLLFSIKYICIKEIWKCNYVA